MPEDYGCVGMLAIFIAVSNTFIDGGFGNALIQKKEPSQEDYSTIFWLNLVLSVVIYMVLYMVAPYVADFYNLPLLSSVLRVQSIILIINALGMIQQNKLRKGLFFKKIAAVNLGAVIISVMIAIYLAFIGWGVWALVTQQIALCLLNTIFFTIAGKWKPSFVFSKESFSKLFSFGGFIFLSNIINTFCNNVQGLLIGRFFNPIIMGYYAQARKLEEIASSSFSSVVDQVSYPVLSKFQSDNESMRNVVKKLIMALSFVSFPLMLVLILEAEPLIMLLYGEKWLSCIPYFKILCVAGIAICLQGIHYYAVASKGESKDLFVWTIIKRTIGLLILLIGMYFWDIKGLLWGSSVTAWFIFFSNAYLLSKHINYTLFQQIKDILPICLTSLLPFVFIYMYDGFYIFNMYIKALVSFSTYVVIYIGLSYLFRIKAMWYCAEILKIKRNNYDKNRTTLY